MPNRLALETSPYLRQHADNPVDWYPWGDEVLALARSSDLPILLSVGYSACHWCHVMAHECFEDADTAALMNRHFVNIKVDREERPDLDQIYQTAHQLLAGRSGGWPLTMFLTSHGKPFFSGTYFPKHPRYNLPGFDSVLQRVAELWGTRRADVETRGADLVQQLARTVPARDGLGTTDTGDLLQKAAAGASAALREALMDSFDPINGGFGSAPKFPHPSGLEALLRHAVAHRDEAARDAVLFTLQRMAEGGIYDHLAGGFCRYSTDAQWMIPHFEKMLYDNGPLMRLYAQTWQLTGEPLFRQVCEQTAAWVVREMQSSEGGYFSSVDADSEGEEGRFYVWRREQIAQILSAEEFAVFAPRYGLDGPPNFEGKAWHLYAARPLPDVAAASGRDAAGCAALIDSARARLFAVRATRVRPGRDDKILTSWNALMIEGMAFAGRVFEQPDWIESARRACDFVRSALWRDARLLATYKDGRSHLNAYLDDYAFMLGAVLELTQADTVRAVDLDFACALADALLEHFEDRRDGGFFFTSHDHETLVLRPKSGHDNATPSGNAAAATHLQRLGHLVGEPRYLNAAHRTLTLFADATQRSPHGFATLVSAMTQHQAPAALAILNGPAQALAAWRTALNRRYLPGTLVLQLPENHADLPAALAKPAVANAQAWICRGTHCLPPLTELDQVFEALA